MHGRRTLFRQATRYHRRAESSEEYRSRRSRSGWKVGLSPHLKVPRQGCHDVGHQSSTIRAARNYDGTAWVVYDRQLRREALARRDLNWSATNAWLYSEAFTGRAKVTPRCRYCLSETHDLQACPVNPDNLDPTGRRQSSPGASGKDMCRKSSISQQVASPNTIPAVGNSPRPSNGLDITRLDAALQGYYYYNSLAPSTHRSYACVLRHFNSFCVEYNVFDPFPVNEKLLCNQAGQRWPRSSDD